jgi:predicted negative regulator of RcsB-dependent stress response
VQLLALERQLGDRYYEAVALERMGDVLAAQGQQEQAHDRYAEAATIFDEIHSPRATITRDKMA